MASQTKLCPCYFMLPLCFNPEEGKKPKRIPVETLDEVFAVLERQFGSYTTWPEGEGSWHGLREPVMRVCVAVPESEIDKLRYVIGGEIGRILKQKEMYFERGSPTVELIEVEH